MTSRLRRLIVALSLGLWCLFPALAFGQAAIAVDGDHFTVDRADGAGPRAKFLLFISYFDGLRATDLNGDLDYIANTLHFDGIRVLPNWQRRTPTYCEVSPLGTDTLFDAVGNVRGDTSPPTAQLKTLLDLIEAARVRHLVVDVSFTRQTVAGAGPGGLNVDNYVRAVTRMATILRPHRNVVFDLENEVEQRDLQEPDVKRLRDAILENADPTVGDPARVVVVSRSGDIGGVVAYNQSVGTSAVAYHDPRVTNWWDTQVPVVVNTLRTSGKPVYLQEPQAWNSGLQICTRQEPSTQDADGTALHFRTAVQKARESGAAAWTFHTRQSFRLDVGGSLRSRIQANGTEKDLLEGTPTEPSLSAAGAAGPWAIDTRLTVTVNGTGDGSVTSTPAGINCGGVAQACSATFPPGTAITLTATAQSGSAFQAWAGGCTGSGGCSVTLDESKTVNAQFTALERVLYYDVDAIGSVRMVTDGQAAVLERHDYTPFGVEHPVAASFSPKLFAGKELDPETGLSYFGGRHLAPFAGRFITADPLLDPGAAVNDPQRWNRYIYVRNTPTRLVDPDGRLIFDWQEFKRNAELATHIGQNGHGWLLPTVAGIAAIGSVAGDLTLVAGEGIAVVRGAIKGVSAAGTAIRGLKPWLAAEARSASIEAVIGHFEAGYAQIGKHLRVATFDIPQEVWNRLGQLGQREAANRAFLDGLIAKGARIFVATTDGIRKGSILEWEVKYLLDAGYQWADNGWMLIPKIK